jgi:hypothetical protein
MKFSDKTFIFLLLILCLFNFGDGALTLYWVSNGFASEMNPIMDMWIEMGASHFLFVKVSIALMSCFLLWVSRKNKLAHILLILVILIYLSILLIHAHIALKVFIN